MFNPTKRLTEEEIEKLTDEELNAYTDLLEAKLKVKQRKYERIKKIIEERANLGILTQEELAEIIKSMEVDLYN